MADTRVEIVGLRGIPGVMGGVEAHCEELIPRIAALAPDLDIELIARLPYVGGGTRQYRGVTVTPLYAPRNASFEAIVSTFLGVWRAYRRRAMLVHIHGIGPALMAPLARLLGMRVIVTHHSLNYDHEKWGRFARLMLRLGERSAAHFADRIIAVAPWLADRLARSFPDRRERIAQIPNGKTTFPRESDAGAILAELGVSRGSYVLAVGRLTPEKAFHVLIEALEQAGWPHPLIICGAADHATAYSRALLARASPTCIFAGARQKSALKTLYEGAALFVLPSDQEGMPIAALEAGAFGCPILLSDIAPNRDLALPDACYFPVGDASALAAKLTQNPSSFALPADVFDRHDWDRIAERTLALYRLVLAQ